MKRIARLIRPRRSERDPSRQEAERRDFARPAFEQHEREDGIELTVYLPEVREDAVEVCVEDRDVVITAARPHPLRPNFAALHLERSLRDYRLRARVGAGVLLGALHAELIDGVLRILLPTEAHSRGWQVAVV